MPAGGICPQCRNNVSPMARFCARCGLELAARDARVVWGWATFVGFFVGIVFLILLVGSGILFLIRTVPVQQKNLASSQTMAQTDEAAANTEAQREAVRHANDAWWDPAQPDGMKAEFFGKDYLIGPGEWTSIDVRTPATSGRYRYVVEIEGVDRFRARPDGYAEREFVYSSGEGFQPYQMSAWCRTLLVQPMDGAVHRVRVKYVRVGRNEGGAPQ